MIPIPTIAECFETYLRAHESDVDPLTEDQIKQGFFCGFWACLCALDALAELTAKDEGEGDQAWQRLHAEYDRFCQSTSDGKLSTSH